MRDKKILLILTVVTMLVIGVAYSKSRSHIKRGGVGLDRIDNTTTVNNEYGYSFSYPTTLKIYPADSYAEESKLVKLTRASKIIFEVIVVSKTPVVGEYDGSVYDPFTHEIKMIVNVPIGVESRTANGSFIRLPDETFAGETVKVYSWYKQKRLVFENENYFYVVGISEDERASLPASSFEFETK